MPNLEFSVPYDEDQPEALTEVFRLKNHGGNTIREIYLSGPQLYSGSGRVINNETGLGRFLETVGRIHKEGIRVNLVLNSVCEGGEWYSPGKVREMLRYLDMVHGQYGVEAVTIANPLFVQHIRKQFPDLEICASVLADIDCLQRADMFVKDGASVITPDVNINRDLKLLKDIKDITGAQLRLMVNEGCLYKCPYRKFHFNYISHRSTSRETELPAFSTNCRKITSNDRSQVLRSCWIRPEDLRKYSDITRFFKVVGRGERKSKMLRALAAYLNESYDGDLLDILFSNIGHTSITTGASLDNKTLSRCGFFEKVTSCNRDCAHCDYCEKMAEKLISTGNYSREKLTDAGIPNPENVRKIEFSELCD